jgi:transposase-like protein
MPKRARGYPLQFRADAVKLAKERGIVTATARDLGISLETLRNWIRQADIDAGSREGLNTESFDSESVPRPAGAGRGAPVRWQQEQGTGPPEVPRLP